MGGDLLSTCWEGSHPARLQSGHRPHSVSWAAVKTDFTFLLEILRSS